MDHTFVRPARENRMLRRLPVSERLRISALTKNVPLSAGDVLCEAGARMRHVFFPHEGIISLHVGSASVEVAVVGFEGVFGLHIAAGKSTSPVRATVSASGAAAKMLANAFPGVLKQCPVLREALLVHADGLLHQAFQKIACTSAHSASARLAGMILSRGDCLRSSIIAATQESLALNLGVLRSAVGMAAGRFQRQGLIAYRRGEIKILNRRGLITEACPCFRVVAGAFREAVR